MCYCVPGRGKPEKIHCSSIVNRIVFLQLCAWANTLQQIAHRHGMSPRCQRPLAETVQMRKKMHVWLFPLPLPSVCFCQGYVPHEIKCKGSAVFWDRWRLWYWRPSWKQETLVSPFLNSGNLHVETFLTWPLATFCFDLFCLTIILPLQSLICSYLLIS